MSARTFTVLGKSDEEVGASAIGAGLALRVDELRRIAGHLQRDPTIVEAYAFDAQWSEHCSYKSSRHHLKKLPTTGPTVVMGPGQDAGIVHLGEHDGERYGIVVAHESHNHPSQVVPFEGAATGVGGIVRDVLCMGAHVVAIADALRFGRVEDPDSHQRYVATSVVDGIAAYGNAIGVPNIAGDVYFDEGFNDNCLVNVIALGIVKESDIIHSAAPPGSAGWDIVLVGKATDASGFGGAAFSSLALDAQDAEANKGAVQVPDPFLKNVIMRASYRVFEYLRENKITAGFKDLGAGGIMGCTAEICASGGFGAIIDLDDVSTSQENLPPAVIAIGETQERLTWVLPPEVTSEVLRIYNEEFSLPEIARGARAAVIGCVQKEKQYVMRTGSDIVMDVPIEFLTGSIKDEHPFDAKRATPAAHRHGSTEPQDALSASLAALNRCSRAPLYKQYDGVVRGATVLSRGVADAGVFAPVPGSPLGMAVSVAGDPIQDDGDAHAAAERAVIDAIRKVVAVGATPAGLTDCLNFGNPNKREHYSQFVAAVDGLAAASTAMGVPFVSGNVSLYNEAKVGNAVPPSPIVGCVGTLEDVSRVITPCLKRAGNALYVLQTADRRSVDDLLAVMGSGLIKACKVVDHGIVAAIAFMAFAGANTLGSSLEPMPDIASEAPAFIVEVEDAVHFEASWKHPMQRIGEVSSERALRTNTHRYDVDELHDAWSKPLAEVYG